MLVPQSLGAALAMPFAGRLADRVGGGPLALAGVVLTAVSTIPLALISADTAVWQIEASLLLRGLGIGIAIMPAMSAAYAVLRPEQIADATPQLTVVQRVGGSIGTAVLAVVLGASLEGAADPAGASAAFSSAYWWAFAITLVAVVPATILLRTERKARRAHGARADLAATEAALEAA
jgi:MFS family permease